MTQTELTMSAPQDTKPQNSPAVKPKSFKRIAIKTDGQGPNLYYHEPVCDHCRIKKTACTHRAIYDEWDNTVKPAEEPPKLDGPKPTSGKTKKADKPALKIITKSIETAGEESETSAETATAPQRPRRSNAGKRKLDDVSVEDTATNDSKRQKIERKKPGRKPHQKTPIPTIVIEDVEAEPVSVSSPATEPSTTPAAIRQQAVGNISPSIDMAWHRGMTGLLGKHIDGTKQKWEILQNTIKEAEKQWEDVKHSMEATKRFMNEWTSRWTMSDAFTL